MKYTKESGGNRGRGERDDAPLSGVANLFDVAIVFALGLIVMLLMYLSIPEVVTQMDRYNSDGVSRTWKSESRSWT